MGPAPIPYKQLRVRRITINHKPIGVGCFGVSGKEHWEPVGVDIVLYKSIICNLYPSPTSCVVCPMAMSFVL